MMTHRESLTGQAPIIVGVGRNTKSKFAHVIREKRAEAYAIERIAKEINKAEAINKARGQGRKKEGKGETKREKGKKGGKKEKKEEERQKKERNPGRTKYKKKERKK